MSRGRRAEPAQAKVLRGNFRPDRHDHGPAVELSLPQCPTWLPASAKRYWKEIGAELAKVGLIGMVDTAAFSAHCDSFGKYQEVTEKLQTIEDMLDKTPQGFMVQSALFTIRNKLWEQVMKSSGEFGLSPAARSRVKTTAQQSLPLDDPWDGL